VKRRKEKGGRVRVKDEGHKRRKEEEKKRSKMTQSSKTGRAGMSR